MENHRANNKAKHVPLANVLRQRKTEMMMMNKEQNMNLGNMNYGGFNGNNYY